MDTEFEGEFHRPSRDSVLQSVALAFSRRGTCGRAQVGAVIARDGRILVTGYNGPVAGANHCSPSCLQASSEGCVRSVHAEANCIAYAARHGISVDGATLYCTHLPCRNCAELIINSGLARVVYQNDYRIRDGEQLMRESGIDIMMIS